MPLRRDETWDRNFNRSEFYIRQAVNEGLSFGDWYETAKETGLSYRYTNMRADWRDVQSLYRWESSLQGLDPDAEVPDLYTIEGRAGQRYNYLAGVEYSYWDHVENKWAKSVRMVTSEGLSTTDDYVGQAEDLFAAGGTYDDPTAHGFTLRFINRRPGL